MSCLKWYFSQLYDGWNFTLCNSEVHHHSMIMNKKSTKKFSIYCKNLRPTHPKLFLLYLFIKDKVGFRLTSPCLASLKIAEKSKISQNCVNEQLYCSYFSLKFATNWILLWWDSSMGLLLIFLVLWLHLHTSFSYLMFVHFSLPAKFWYNILTHLQFFDKIVHFFSL